MIRDYPRIREQIYRYMAKKQSGSLEEEKLLPFVTSQERLPRELVSQVLSDLTQRAYLDIRRGKLNAINFPLPLQMHQPVSATRMPGTFSPCQDNNDVYNAVAV
ncbi:hypothetical protein [Klebsiella aerogenes]|uniref:hypothetical protein n=1 Tax=Klebsiella aerogenes TaxID=548 RepID=UPI0013A68085|nr:hypothetical protein [Klebsiella aerogenes]HCB2860457.1 hypothetical protein [Klebsiella aerogenes]HCB2865467.1 hypothetical protein [Klebsiella aerogenes]HCB2881676.1 hypothetical protein [Klebsiella aerogenes]HCB3346424.1 hypothetical protein [Klebsiella aerogenes]HCM1812525.1 hypothetical protein [Klebsiella aerogenes]